MFNSYKFVWSQYFNDGENVELIRKSTPIDKQNGNFLVFTVKFYNIGEKGAISIISLNDFTRVAVLDIIASDCSTNIDEGCGFLRSRIFGRTVVDKICCMSCSANNIGNSAVKVDNNQSYFHDSSVTGCSRINNYYFHIGIFQIAIGEFQDIIDSVNSSNNNGIDHSGLALHHGYCKFCNIESNTATRSRILYSHSGTAHFIHLNVIDNKCMSNGIITLEKGSNTYVSDCYFARNSAAAMFFITNRFEEPSHMMVTRCFLDNTNQGEITSFSGANSINTNNIDSSKFVVDIYLTNRCNNLPQYFDISCPNELEFYYCYSIHFEIFLMFVE